MLYQSVHCFKSLVHDKKYLFLMKHTIIDSVTTLLWIKLLKTPFFFVLINFSLIILSFSLDDATSRELEMSWPLTVEFLTQMFSKSKKFSAKISVYLKIYFLLGNTLICLSAAETKYCLPLLFNPFLYHLEGRPRWHVRDQLVQRDISFRRQQHTSCKPTQEQLYIKR